MNKEEILQQIQNRRNQIEALEDEIEDLNLELKKLNNSEKPYIVRVYINSSRKNYREKKFKTLKAAENFVINKCSNPSYEGYFNLGVTLSVVTSDNKEYGEFSKVYYPLLLNRKDGSRLYDVSKFLENLLNLRNDYINLSFYTTVTNSHSQCDKFSQSLSKLVSTLKNTYLKDAVIQKNEYKENQILYSQNPQPIEKLISDIQNDNILIDGLKVTYFKEPKKALFEIEIK